MMTDNIKNNPDTITRKEAIKKIGKYASLTALGTYMILNPQKAQAASPAAPGTGFFVGGNSTNKSGGTWGKPKKK